MYIEPCCIHNQLPKLLREHPQCFFQSNGDWGIEKLMTAVACMSDGKDMLISIPTIDIDFCRVLHHWFNRKWIGRLELITWFDQTDLLRQELPEYMDSITHIHDTRLLDGLIWFKGTEANVIVQGDLLLQNDNNVHLYSGYFGNDAEIIKEAVAPLQSIIKLRTKK